MSYWKYKTENIHKDWCNFIQESKDWWEQYGALVVFLVPGVLILGGIVVCFVHIQLGLVLAISGGICFIIFIAYISIDDELTEFRKWKKEQLSNHSKQTEVNP